MCYINQIRKRALTKIVTVSVSNIIEVISINSTKI